MRESAYIIANSNRQLHSVLLAIRKRKHIAGTRGRHALSDVRGRLLQRRVAVAARETEEEQPHAHASAGVVALSIGQ